MKRQNQTKNKKAVSIMIGYVLLVTIAVVIGALVFQWMRTYVAEPLEECPSEVSLTLDKVECNLGTLDSLTLDVRNNGRFDVGGYFIRATTSSEQELATFDLSGVGGYCSGSPVSSCGNLLTQDECEVAGSGCLWDATSGNCIDNPGLRCSGDWKESQCKDFSCTWNSLDGGNMVIYIGSADNAFETGQNRKAVFDLDTANGGPGQIYSVELIPVRFQEVDNRKRRISCSKSIVKEAVSCT